MEIYEDCPAIWVGIDKTLGPDVVVKADGKLLGPANWLVDHIWQGLVESERQNTIQMPEWLGLFQQDVRRRIAT